MPLLGGWPIAVRHSWRFSSKERGSDDCSLRVLLNLICGRTILLLLNDDAFFVF